MYEAKGSLESLSYNIHFINLPHYRQVSSMIVRIQPLHRRGLFTVVPCLHNREFIHPHCPYSVQPDFAEYSLIHQEASIHTAAPKVGHTMSNACVYPLASLYTSVCCMWCIPVSGLVPCVKYQSYTVLLMASRGGEQQEMSPNCTESEPAASVYMSATRSHDSPAQLTYIYYSIL